jgi:regulator of protease activity HflC (stomatin/prohibitin superfamily)
MRQGIAGLVVGFALIAVAVVGFFHWTINRVYVPKGKSLMLRYKGPLIKGMFVSPPRTPPGEFADITKGQVGVLAELRGPGRHFYCPIWWERKIVDDQVVEPGHVAVVTSKMGTDLEPGQFLVDGLLGETKHKGILRKVYGPGRYRVNPYAYEFTVVGTERFQAQGQTKYGGWVDIPTGYVGVVTNLTNNPITGAQPGIQDKVLPAGIYPINPREQQIDIVGVGYWEQSIEVTKQLDRAGNLLLDESGETVVADKASGINFPSDDAFPINMDFTAIWGILPEQAPTIVRTFGTLQAAETKVVVPQIESICRTTGSRYSAVGLLIGESRETFQTEVTRQLQDILDDKGIRLSYGLVRHIYIPAEVRVPIQNANIANELKLTRDQEQLTAKTEANLKEAERKVELESQRTKVDTVKKVAQVKATGDKMARETDAETTRLIAAIDKQTAELESQAKVLLGQAKADAETLNQRAKADRFRLAVEAFGTGDAYNQWVFANGLPSDIKLNLLYAGTGTFWTDLKGFEQVLLGRQAQGTTQNPAAAPQPPSARNTGRSQ